MVVCLEFCTKQFLSKEILSWMLWYVCLRKTANGREHKVGALDRNLPTSSVTFWAWSSTNVAQSMTEMSTEGLPGRRSWLFCSVQDAGWVAHQHQLEKWVRVLSTPSTSHSQAELSWNLFRGEPHYVRLNNLYGNSAAKVSFVVMNTDHKLSPELLSQLFFIILFLALLYFRSTEGIHPTMFSSQLFLYSD